MDINLTKKAGIKLKTAGKYCQEDINVKPVLQNKTINANGTYTADNNYAGLGTVTVSMSTATIKLQEKSATPTITSQSITPDTDKGYNGLSKVTVNAIQTETKEIDANGTYTPTDGKFFSSVSVNVPTGGTTVETETRTITTNGTHYPTSGKYFSQVTVAVPTGGGSTDNTKLSALIKRTVREITEDYFTDVTYIGDYAFAYCRNLISVSIPNSITSIKNSSFHGCIALPSITIPDSVTSIDGRAFSYCYGMTSITIPNSVTTIGEYVFQGCSGLTSVTIGNSVKSIGSHAFSQNTKLKEVTVLAVEPPLLSGLIFGGCSALITIKVPSASLSAYQGASNWSEYASKMEGI